MAVSTNETPNTNSQSEGSNVVSHGEQLRDQGQRVMAAAAERTREFAGKVEDRAGQAISSVGDKMSSFGENIRERAPKKGAVGSALNTVAESLESGGHYLSGRDVSEIKEDVTAVVRRHPVQSLWIGLGLGFIVGAMTASRRR